MKRGNVRDGYIPKGYTKGEKSGRGFLSPSRLWNSGLIFLSDPAFDFFRLAPSRLPPPLRWLCDALTRHSDGRSSSYLVADGHVFHALRHRSFLSLLMFISRPRTVSR